MQEKKEGGISDEPYKSHVLYRREQAGIIAVPWLDVFQHRWSQVAYEHSGRGVKPERIAECINRNAKRKRNNKCCKNAEFKRQHQNHHRVHHWIEQFINLNIVHHKALYQDNENKIQAIF